jgi:hypothetical protein
MSTNIQITSFITAMSKVAEALPTPQEQPNDEPIIDEHGRTIIILVSTCIGLYLTCAGVFIFLFKRRRWRWARLEATRQHQLQTNAQHAAANGQQAEGDSEGQTKITRAANFSLPKAFHILLKGGNETPDKASSVDRVGGSGK